MTVQGSALEDMKEIIDEFMIEAEEIIAKLDADMVKLEKQSSDLNLLNEIFRGAHTIKGTSGFLGFDRLSEFTHKMEDVLNKLRKGEIIINADIMDVLLESIDTLKGLLEETKSKGDALIDLSPIKAKLVAVDNGTFSEVAALVEKKKGAKASATKKTTNGKKNAPVIAAIDPVAEQVKSTLPEAPAEMPASTVDLSDDINVESIAARPDPAQMKQSQDQRRPVDSTIRVDVERLDSLMNIMGELVLGRNALVQLAGRINGNFEGEPLIDELNHVTSQMNFVTSELQMAVMKMRMLPVGKVFNKFPRVVRDLSRSLEKDIELIISGEETELDKSVIEEIGDPLVHLIRNAVDHGIEQPAEREAAGKPRCGRVELIASQEGSNIVIKVVDDGAGLDAQKLRSKAVERGLSTQEEVSRMSDREVFNFIFNPGFSLAKRVTDVSGRGVGMDVVRTNIEKLKGIVNIESELGKGTSFIIKLPLTLAIVQGLLVENGADLYILPLSSVLETVKVSMNDIYSINNREVIRLRDTVLPIIDLNRMFFPINQHEKLRNLEHSYVVVLSQGERRLGIVVDRLIGQEEVVIKSLGEFLGTTPGIAGATILGDGRVRLIVDPVGIFSMTNLDRDTNVR